MTDIFTLIIAILGALGWVPRLCEYLRPKPQLRINGIRFEIMDTGPTDRLIIELENKRCVRPAMATNIYCLYVIYKDDGTRLADNHNRTNLIGYLAPGTKYSAFLDCTKVKYFDAETVNVYIKVYCDEGITTTKTFKNIDLSKTETRAESREKRGEI